ncbi:MAG: T9SS type A sorting domain-containing protein [Candidatus Eisenbacteria sp.]|nr:T9SS type A sorting domain-containing protein [Candidatus Eisenbacteria bacterium]
MFGRIGSLTGDLWPRSTLLLTVAVALICLPSLVVAVPTVYIDPVITQVDVGEQFDVSIMINADVDTIANFQIFVEFDPAVLEFVNALEGSLYTNLLPGFWTWFGAEEESLGTWEVFDIVFPSGSFVIAPGELVRLRFNPIAEGYSELDLVSVVVTDIERYPIEALSWDDGAVYVGPFSGVPGDARGPTRWNLGDPFPNPSRGATRISLTRPIDAASEECHFGVYDVEGRMVRDLTDLLGKTSDLAWDGRSRFGIGVPSGVYFFRLVTPEGVATRKVILVR